MVRGLRVPIKTRVNLLPQTDLQLQGVPADFLSIGDDIGLQLAFPVLQGPKGTRIGQADSNGNLLVALGEQAGAITTELVGPNGLPISTSNPQPVVPPAAQIIELIAPRTDTVTNTIGPFAVPPATAFYFMVRTTAVTGTTPSMQVILQGLDTKGAGYNQITFTALTSVSAVVGVVGPGLSPFLINPTYQILVNITGTTPSFSWYMDMAYK